MIGKARLILMAIVASLGVSAAARAQNMPLPTPAGQLAADDLVFSRLHTLVLVNFHHTPLKTAIKALANAAGVNVFVDWQSLASGGIRETTRMTLRFNGPVSVRTALSFLLARLSPGGMRASFTVSHGVLFFGTLQAVETRRVIRVYGGLAGPPVPPGSQDYLWQRQQLFRIMLLLQNNVDRNRWIDNGGIGASATIFRGMLVIKADENMQRRIQRLLRHLTEVLAGDR